MINEIELKNQKRKIKEKKLNQNGIVIWFSGLSGSGKSTLAYELERQLINHGRVVVVLDGDDFRNGLNVDLGFSVEDRKENVRRIAEVAKALKDNGLIVLVSLITPSNLLREIAKVIVGADDFKLVFVSSSLEVCEQRDVKGLYKRARNGFIKEFTGISSAFEVPLNPSIILHTDHATVENCVHELKMKFNI